MKEKGWDLMVKYLLYVIITISLFPFQGHLAVLAGLCTSLMGIFVIKIIKGTITIKQVNYRNNKYFIIFMLLLLLYSIASIFWARDIGGWMNYNIYLYIATSIFLVSNYVFNTVDDFIDIFKYISLISIIHNIIGWINITTKHYIFSSSPLIPDFLEKGNPLSLFNNTNDFATFLVFSIFVNIIIVMIEKRKWARVFYSVNILSSLILIYETMSRANYLALLLGIMAYILLISNKKNLLYFFGVSFCVLALVLYMIPTVNITVNNVLFGKVFNFGDEIRVNLIKNAFLFLNESKGFGIGAGNIAHYLQNYSTYYTNNINSLHNWWLDILVNYGVVFFISYIIFYIKMIIKLNKIRLAHHSNLFLKYTSISFISILFAYTIGSTSSSSNFPIIWIWVFFSIITSFLNIETSDQTVSVLNLNQVKDPQLSIENQLFDTKKHGGVIFWKL